MDTLYCRTHHTDKTLNLNLHRTYVRLNRLQFKSQCLLCSDMEKKTVQIILTEFRQLKVLLKNKCSLAYTTVYHQRRTLGMKVSLIFPLA